MRTTTTDEPEACDAAQATADGDSGQQNVAEPAAKDKAETAPN
jgi:hypothetical protein